MKAILAFAVLVIVAQATTPLFFQGFTDQIGLNREQMKHGEVCFDSLRQVMMDIHRLIQSKEVGVAEALRSAIVLMEDVENKLKIDCSIYMQDILFTLVRPGRTVDPAELARKNWNTYSVEIIQQVAMYFDFIMAGNEYEAGKTEAYIYQILLGVRQPQVLPTPQFNYNKYVDLNITKYIVEFTTSYYKTLGIDNKRGIQDNIDCSMAQINMIENLKKLDMESRYVSSTSQWLHIVEKQIHEAIALYDACHDAFAFNLEKVVMPIAGAWRYAPVHATLAVVHNIALHLPELKHDYIQMIVDLQEGEYSEAGSLYAQQLLTVIKNIY